MECMTIKELALKQFQVQLEAKNRRLREALEKISENEKRIRKKYAESR